MTDDRFKAWLAFSQFVLGTVVLGIFSTVISNQIQTRDVEIKEQEANAKYLDQVLNDNEGVRLKLAQYFARVSRSKDVHEKWSEYEQLIKPLVDELKK